MLIYNIAKAEKLFQALDTMMENRGLLWTNLVGLLFDSANVMVCVRNSTKLNPILTDKSFCLGCLCNLANLCATAALKILPLSLDNLFFYHFKYSVKRWEQYREIQAECEEI